jgi:hypothetical protein
MVKKKTREVRIKSTDITKIEVTITFDLYPEPDEGLERVLADIEDFINQTGEVIHKKVEYVVTVPV